MKKLKKEWIKDWDLDDIISNAVSLGMEFMASRVDEKTLKYNKKILLDALKSMDRCRICLKPYKEVKDKITGKIDGNMVRRNAVIRGWLEQAARLDPFFLNDKCTTKPQLSPKLPSVAV